MRRAQPASLRSRLAASTIAAITMIAIGCNAATADTWRPQPFSAATLTLQSPLGELRFGASLTDGKPRRLAGVTLSVDGRSVDVPAAAYRDAVNPRLQETLALVPQDCSATPCNATAALMIHFYPALGNPKLPKTAACASSWLRIVFDRERVQDASVVECLGSKHERERRVYPATG